MSTAIIATHMDERTGLYHPVITDEEGEIEISVGFDVPSEAYAFGVEVRSDYETLLRKGNIPSPSRHLAVTAPLYEAPHAN